METSSSGRPLSRDDGRGQTARRKQFANRSNRASPSRRCPILNSMSVLVMAGPSSVGKTTAARRIGSEVGASIWSVDGLARDHSHPALAFEKDATTWAMPPEALCELLIAKGRALWPEIETFIRKCETQSRTIVDGEGPEPEVVKQLPTDLGISAVFVVELDVRRLDRTLRERSIRYRLLPPAHQANVAHMNVCYGEWLVEECERVGLPWINSQPWATLAQRTIAAWDPSLNQGRAPAEEQSDLPQQGSDSTARQTGVGTWRRT